MDGDRDMTELIGADGIFLRTADLRRFDYVMRGVREDSLSLALSSENDGVLDHYGRLLINKLRKSDGLQIEVFLPQNTEALLERFNQILADLSIDEARNAETSQAPRRVLLAHDAKAISERDLQLLARLVQDFPGAHVSLVLLVDKAGLQMHEKTIEKFGQRMLRWPLETPTREEGEALIAAAGSMGYDVEAKKVLANTGYAKPAPRAPSAPAAATTPAVTPKAAPTAAPAARESAATPTPSKRALEEKVMSGAELAAMRQKVLQDSSGRTEPSLDAHATQPKPEFRQPSARRKIIFTVLRWSAALLLLLAIAATVLLLLFQQHLGALVYTSPLLKANLPEWAMNAVVSVTGKPPTALLEEARAAAREPSPSVPPAQADLNDNKLASGKAAAVTTEASAGSAAKAEVKPEVKAEVKAEIKPEAEAKPALKPEAAVAVSSKPEAAKPEAVPPTTPAADPKATVAEALAPRSERGADQAIRQARAGSYFVQHVSLGAMAEAQEWRAQYAALKKSRIAAVTAQDQSVKFVVLSGPFANLKEAESFGARPGVPADPWLRPVKSLQRALVKGSR